MGTSNRNIWKINKVVNTQVVEARNMSLERVVVFYVIAEMNGDLAAKTLWISDPFEVENIKPGYTFTD